MLAAVGEVGEEVKREVLSEVKGNGVSTWQNHSNIFLSLFQSIGVGREESSFDQKRNFREPLGPCLLPHDMSPSSDPFYLLPGNFNNPNNNPIWLE